MHDCDFNGVWLEREAGATLTLHQRDNEIVGDWVGGRWHETLRGRFTGHRCEGGFEGDYVNHEGAVNGVGRMRLEALGPHQIKFFGHGAWSGGGTQGEQDGCYILERHH
jgi:hypothetical protein